MTKCTVIFVQFYFTKYTLDFIKKLVLLSKFVLSITLVSDRYRHENVKVEFFGASVPISDLIIVAGSWHFHQLFDLFAF